MYVQYVTGRRFFFGNRGAQCIGEFDPLPRQLQCPGNRASVFHLDIFQPAETFRRSQYRRILQAVKTAQHPIGFSSTVLPIHRVPLRKRAFAAAKCDASSAVQAADQVLVSVDRDHDVRRPAPSPLRRCRASWLAFSRAAEGAVRRRTPGRLSSTTNSVPGAQLCGVRILLGSTICPLVDSRIVSG